MKILIFGIDGLGEKSLNAFNLKRLKRRVEESKSFSPFFDNVVSRGWTEIYSGKTAYETGAFFQVPIKENNKIKITQSTGQSCVDKHIGNNNMLWKVLNSFGHRVGVFCVPTATKKESLEGFFVAATGAGKIGKGLSKDDFYPSTLFDGLEIDNIDLGFRMGYGAYLPEDLLDLEKKVNKHIADYFYMLNILNEHEKVDVLFVGARLITEFAYKFIKLMLKDKITEQEKQLKDLLYRLADNFDIMLDEFISKVNPDHLFIVSDHGIGPLDYNVNINELLFNRNYIKSKSSLKSNIKSYIDPLRRKIYRKKIGDSFPEYELESSEAFSVGFTDLIYINDSRFTGKEMTQDELYIKAQKIASFLDDYCKNNGISQFIKFEPLNNTKYVNDQKLIPLPNIRVHMDSGCANRFRTYNKIVEDNLCEFGSELFEKGFFGEYSGCKTTDIIISYTGNYEINKMDKLSDLYYEIIKVAKSY